MSMPDPTLLAEVLRHALDGVAVVDGAAGAPRIVYANATLAALLRRPEEWPPGRALDEIEIEAPADPNGTSVGVGQWVRLRRADGSTVECERWALLLPDARLALHYRPLPRSAPGALAAAVDRSSGLSTPEHLMEVLRRDWSIAQRDGRTLTLMRVDVDACQDYLLPAPGSRLPSNLAAGGSSRSPERQAGMELQSGPHGAGGPRVRGAEAEVRGVSGELRMQDGRRLEKAWSVVGGSLQ